MHIVVAWQSPKCMYTILLCCCVLACVHTKAVEGGGGICMCGHSSTVSIHIADQHNVMHSNIKCMLPCMERRLIALVTKCVFNRRIMCILVQSWELGRPRCAKILCYYHWGRPGLRGYYATTYYHVPHVEYTQYTLWLIIINFSIVSMSQRVSLL